MDPKEELINFRAENPFDDLSSHREIHIRHIALGRRSSTILEKVDGLYPDSIKLFEMKIPENADEKTRKELTEKFDKEKKELIKKFEKKLLSSFNKNFHCSGGITDTKEYGRAVKMTGDQRENLKQFLVESGLAREDEIKTHGV